MRFGGRRAMLGASVAAVCGVAASVLSGSSAGSLGPTGLTPAERASLRIASVRAIGAEGAGLVVKVTFAGNLEKTIGRGNLKRALVAVIFRPKDPRFKTADLATEGAGPIGLTSRKTRSSAVGVVRKGRTFTFFIAAAGTSNVARVQVKAFTSPPGRKPARRVAGSTVSPDEWAAIEEEIAIDQRGAELRSTGAAGYDCEQLRGMLDATANDLARARVRQHQLELLRSKIVKEIAEVENETEGKGLLADALHRIYAPIGVAIRLWSGETPRQLVEDVHDALRSLRFDRRIVDRLIVRNQNLIDGLLELQRRLEALYAEKCKPGTTPPPPPVPSFDVNLKTSSTHPGGGKSLICVRVTTSPPKPGASVRVEVKGPDVVGPADQSLTLDPVGEEVVEVIIEGPGTYTVTVTVSADGATKSATATEVVTEREGTCPPP